MPRLILASTSPYRRALLERLGLPFEAAPPGIEERALRGETPLELAVRLARAKAERLATPGAIVIGADQVAMLDGERLGKPGNAVAALEQLRRCQGREVVFLSAVAVVGPAAGEWREGLDRTTVQFARLPEPLLERYLEREQPYDCAGSFKAEGLGIALVEKIESSDPTGLLGLPMIWLTATLRAAGLEPLAE